MYQQSSDLILTEYAKKYKCYSWLQCFGLLFLTGGIGMIMIVIGMGMKSLLRRKLVERGIDPEPWEQPLRLHARRVIYGGVVGMLLIGLCIFVYVVNHIKLQ